MNNLEKFLVETEEFKRLKELHQYFKADQKLNSQLQNFLNIQKQLVKTKVEQDFTNLKMLEQKYQNAKKEILLIPFVEEYFELLEYFKQVLENIKSELEEQIFASLTL